MQVNLFLFCSYPACGKTIRRPVSRVLSPSPQWRGMAIPLGRPSPGVSRDLPGRLARKPAFPPERERRPYLVLLPVGFAVPPPLPASRCALTAPFHPRPQTASAAPTGRLLSVALSLGSPPPGITRHRVSVEPGLSSPGSPRERPSGRLITPSCRLARRPFQASARTVSRPSRRASVSRSAMPSTRAGRKWRWKAMTTSRVDRSFRPFRGIR
jgi:hypothetical protein